MQLKKLRLEKRKTIKNMMAKNLQLHIKYEEVCKLLEKRDKEIQALETYINNLTLSGNQNEQK